MFNIEGMEERKSGLYKVLLAALAVSAISFTLAGCRKTEPGDELVGKWQLFAVGIRKVDADLGATEMVRDTRLTLRADRTYEWDLAGSKRYGSWKLSDRIVSFTSLTSAPGSDIKSPAVTATFRVEGEKLVVLLIGRKEAPGEKYWFERVE